MREQLAPLKGKRRKFKGTFVRFGWRSGYKEALRTALLKDVVDEITGKIVADHIWFTVTTEPSESKRRRYCAVQGKSYIIFEGLPRENK